MSRILEGEGIRVVDLSAVEKSKKDCLIQDSSANFSQTAKYISRLLDCPLKYSEVSGSDIQVFLGDKIEREWE
jgi:hypothetical protein